MTLILHPAGVRMNWVEIMPRVSNRTPFRELEERGHKFVRCADDCNIYVKTQRAGERVLGSMTERYIQLRYSH